ncbi:hypothetical protein C8T65DRAFT_833235 [Cerioporus squamosus]|nr:hypothetical protein C8T65DRAFT_833235 [Cerioporus squamosus]
MVATPHLRADAVSTLDQLARSSLHRAALVHPLPGPSAIPEYSTKEAEVRGTVRMLLNASLAETSGVPNAKMRWTLLSFRDRVAVPLEVVLHGWPPEFPFMNLSRTGHVSMKAMRKLLELLQAKPPQLYFVKATPEQLHAAHLNPASVCPGPLFPAPAPNFGYSNIGRRPVQHDKKTGVAIPHRYVRNGPKSAKEVSDEVSAAVDAEVRPSQRRGPLPQLHTPYGVKLGWYSTGWRELPVFADVEPEDSYDS